MKKTKILTLIGIIYCLTGWLNIASSQNLKTNSQSPNEFSRMNKVTNPLPENFNIRLDQKKLSKIASKYREPVNLIYTLDTVIIYSINENPERNIYSYSVSGRQLTHLIQTLISEQWVNFTSETCTYDAYGNVLTSLWKVWKNGEWINSNRETYGYNSNRNKTSFLRELWNNEKWENSERETYTCDSYGNRIAYFSELWSNGAWVNNAHEIYTYDLSGNMLTGFREIWENGYWVNERKYTYTYEVYGDLLSATSETWTNGNWVNTYRETYTYNTGHVLHAYIGEVWSAGSWMFSERYIYLYDSYGHLVTGTGELWVNGIWINHEKEDFTYDANGAVQSLLMQTWASGAWVNFSLTAYSYDRYGNAISGSFYSWDGQTWSFTQDGLIAMYYNNGTVIEYYTGYRYNASFSNHEIGINELRNDNISRFSCSPNPANTSTIITLDLNAEMNAEIKLFNMIGKDVKTISQGYLNVGRHDFFLSTNDIIPGFYFVCLFSGKTLKSIPIVVEN